MYKKQVADLKKGTACEVKMALTIWMKDLTGKSHFWRTKGIIWRKVQFSCKDTAIKWGSFWASENE